MLNPGEESGVPALYPLELLGLMQQQYGQLTEKLIKSKKNDKVYLRASKGELWVLFH